MERRRCSWAVDDPLMIAYHDEEWGRPQHDDVRLFELLILEGAQAGLSWLTILRKRESYRRAYAGFDPAKVARFDAKKQAALLADPGIVRNRLKIAASVDNAKRFLELQAEHGSFDRFVWSFVDGKSIKKVWRPGSVPARTRQSDALSKALSRRGFRFVGSTICYAFMQAAGLVVDHMRGCHLA